MTEPRRSNITFILARPRKVENVEAACAVAAWCGVARLVLVNPDCSASGRETRIADVSVCGTLREAVRDCSLVAGMTRRWGQKRKPAFHSPVKTVARFLRVPGPTAFVFGNETAGLSDEELSLCHIGVTIPTSPACPSLNLSHAAAVVAYEIATHRATEAEGTRSGEESTKEERIPDYESIETASFSIAGYLEDAGYHVREGIQGMRVFIRDFIARSEASEREIRELLSLFKSIAPVSGSRRNR